jgi:hypothetical protein
MAPSSRKQGEVLSYPYLWAWQSNQGETEGRKDRPVCLALPLHKDGITHLFLLAITATPPRPEQTTLAIPEIEKRRAGLRDWKEAWIVIDECYYDVAEHSFYLDTSQAPLGRFSEAFTARIKSALRGALETRSMKRIDRTPD